MYDSNRFYLLFYGIGFAGLLTSVAIMYHKKISWWKRGIYIVFWLYALIILREAIFPIPLENLYAVLTPDNIHYIFSSINWRPFYYGTSPRYDAVFAEVAMNFFITVPVGIVFPLVFNIRKKGFVIALFSCAFGIELLQLVMELIVKIPYRVIDISDVILNSGGFLFGYLLYYLSRKLYYLLQEKRL